MTGQNRWASWRRSILAVGLTLTTACTSFRVETDPLPVVMAERRPALIRVQLSEDRTVDLYGPSFSNDTLRGHPRETAVERYAFPLNSVQEFSTKRFHLGKTLLSIAAIGGGVALFQLIQSSNSTTTF